jgi:glucosamine--fructose-6-phosphate aminotransferase (isomerizing)
VPHTKEVVFLEDGDVAVLRPGGFEVRRGGKAVKPPVTTIFWDAEAAERGGYPHYMLKEIYEQPVTLHKLASELVLDPGAQGDPNEATDPGTPPSLNVDGGTLSPEFLSGVTRVILVAQGTAFHAAMIGRNLIERVARTPAFAELGSDFRYREPLIDKSVLVIAVSQSGETADTLGAVRVAREAGCKVLGVVNVFGSTVARECDSVIYIRSGPEIGVASTKAFTGMVAALYVAAIHMGLAREVLPWAEARRRVSDLLSIGQRVEAVLAEAEPIKKVALKYAQAKNFLFLGRGTGWPLAMEGALKLKEVSYIHAEGYNAGEMKHGPIALIDENMPVLVIALKGRRYEKIVGNIQEVKARGGRVIAIASDDDTRIDSLADDVLRIRDDSGVMNSVLCAVPLQLIAYYIAVALGRDVDNPRNLAKSVTVE